MAKTVFLMFFLALTACDSGLERSDYRGGFVTQNGDCTEKGDLAIDIDEDEIELNFYCFLKNCASMSGKTSQGGYFHLEEDAGQYIQGRVKAEEASGTWFLIIKNKSCSGHWVALKNQ